jgi:PAS domain S-box-containing protein
MNNTKIMIVDDHKENLLALEAALSSLNYEMVSMRSGEDALRYLLKEDIRDIAVILLDVQMPGINGFETAQLIKARENSREIPIIFITAISKSIENVLQGYGVGSVDYLFKPFHPELLKLKVEAFVKLHHYHTEIRTQGEALLKRTSELEEANNQLARSEAIARMIAETSIDTVLILNDSAHILKANEAAVKMLGYSPTELNGRCIGEVLPELVDPRDKVCLQTLIENAAAGKILEGQAVRKDGSRFYADYQLGEDMVQGRRFYVCSIRDVTERKLQLDLLEKKVLERTEELRQSNERLKKSQERFKKMFTSSPCLTAIYRLKDLQLVDVNESWKSHTGFSIADSNQKSDFMEIKKAEPTDGEPYQLGQVYRNLKITYKTKDKQLRDGLLSSEIIEIDDEKCLLQVIVDVTEKVRYEKEMTRFDQLTLVGEMAAGIAHEIRNPMTTIRGFLQMWRKEGGSMSPDFVDIMLGELDRANGIITEYLSLAKNKSSHRETKQINSMIESLFPLIQAEALMTGKDVKIECGACKEMLLDEMEIRQMILNLSINGLEAMDMGGVLKIRTFEEDGCNVLEIIDQGCGIHEEYLRKLGTPFFTTKEKGTGLGLAVCYSIAARHNATIDVNSGAGGTVFSIRFALDA